MSREHSQTPWWFIILLLLMAAPLASWPAVMSAVSAGGMNDTIGTLVMVFPIYAVLSLYLAYRSYARRADLSWVLLAVLLLSYVAVAALVV